MSYALDVYRETHDTGDPWGSAMGGGFALAAILDHCGVNVPDYRPPAVVRGAEPVEYGEDYLTTELWDAYLQGETDEDDLQYAFDILARYRSLAVLSGLDY